jgi:hypothetical protein
MLRDVDLGDEHDHSDQRIIGLLSAIVAIGQFSEFDIRRNLDSLEIARDRLSAILDKAERK